MIISQNVNVIIHIDILCCVISREFVHWCGNPRRTADCKSINVSFRTSPQTGVGIPTVIETTFFYRWRLPRQWRRSLARNDPKLETGFSERRKFLCFLHYNTPSEKKPVKKFSCVSCRGKSGSCRRAWNSCKIVYNDLTNTIDTISSGLPKGWRFSRRNGAAIYQKCPVARYDEISLCGKKHEKIF